MKHTIGLALGIGLIVVLSAGAMRLYDQQHPLSKSSSCQGSADVGQGGSG
jgi:hypothetical protein